MECLPFSTKIWIIIITFFTVLGGFVFAEVVISPPTLNVQENDPANLTCSLIGEESVKYITWYKNENTSAGTAIIGSVSSLSCDTHVITINTTLYDYTCPTDNQMTWTIKKATRQNNGEIYLCNIATLSGNENSDDVQLNIGVPVSSVAMVKPSASIITLRENTEGTFQCKTSGGLPAATVTWFKDSGTSGDSSDANQITSGVSSSTNDVDDLIEVTSTLKYSPSRNERGWRIYCTASNIIDSSAVISVRRPQLNVEYAPDNSLVITDFLINGEYKVIDNTKGQLSCTITGGNPAPILTWNCINSGNKQTINGGKVTKVHEWTARRGQDRTCSCQSSHYSGVKNVSIKIEVLYPATEPTFTVQSTNVSGRIKVIRNNNLSVTCNSFGNPAPSYKWTKPDKVTSTGSELSVTNVQTNGRYTCNVRNVMNPSVGSNVPGSNTSFVDVVLLYPPIIRQLKNESVVEGSGVTITCPVIVGNPPETTYEWSRNGNVWKRTQSFTINPVSRNDAMFYTCQAANLMQQTGEQPASIPDTKSNYLNVLYAATVEEFFITGHKGKTMVVMNETERIPFNCNVDSNPGSDILVNFEQKVLKLGTDTKSLVYSIESATCTDQGKYRCIGYNQHNNNNSTKLLSLFVKCSPRPSPFTTLTENVTSAQNQSAVLTFTALAYPEPIEEDFKWYRWDKNVWQLLTNSKEYQIKTSNLQSNLTIKDVNRTFYGQYKLEVRNDIGSFPQTFYLEPEDVPETPTGFRHVSDLVTQSSITLQWLPGFNNGQEQTFILQFKKSSENDWTSIHLPDRGDNVMNYTINNLPSGTEYSVILYAANSLGNSSLTKIVKIKTNAEEIPPPENLGLIAGAVSGGVALAIICVLVFLIVRKLRIRKSISKNASDKSDRKPVYEDDDDYGMQDNPMYVSAGPRNAQSHIGASSSGGAVEYSTVNKAANAADIVNDNEYAVVNKPKQAKTKPGKKEKEKSKQGFFKDKKGKKEVHEGDIYENAPAKKDEKINENPETSLPEKNVNKDGLLYADLSFNDKPKGQRKLVIHGLDSMTEYVEVDFTKKADPLPDSDDENIPAKN